MDAIMAIAGRHGLLVVEDAAQGDHVDLQGPRRWARIGAPRRAQLPRDQERHLRRRRRAARQRPRAASSAPRSSARRAPTAAGSSAARSTSTPGWTSARRTCPARSSPRSSGRRWRRPTRSPRGAWRSGTAITHAFADLEARGTACAARSSRRTACTTRTCTTCCCRTWRREPPCIERLAARAIGAVFHYVPLHSSPAGLSYGRAAGSMAITDDASDRLVRLPLWIGLEEQQARVINEVIAAVDRR